MPHLVRHLEPLQPTTLDEAMRMAAALYASKLLPVGIRSPEAAFAIIVIGRELGLSAMQSLRSIQIVKGKPTLSADLILLLVKRNPACERFQLVESTDRRALYETKRVGEDATSMALTIADAARAGLLGSENWKKHPKAMLRARCLAALARAVYPDVVLGVYEPDELVEPARAQGGDVSPELEALTLLERIEGAAVMGDLNEAWSDFGEAKDRLAPQHIEAIRKARDERKAALSQEAA